MEYEFSANKIIDRKPCEVQEPETSQHPSNQKMLINSLLELSKAENTQVIITTHTPDIGGTVPKESLRFVTQEDSRKMGKHSDPQVYIQIVGTLNQKNIWMEKD
ncbi:AAA family ATPase [Enterococcus sp. 4E1_DIV0656]|uniref:AAA family ATPase n=1 Tax=Enterococcus sp. 4E1_DIV0656 TaxID=1834180 RepID=UPI0011214C0E